MRKLLLSLLLAVSGVGLTPVANASITNVMPTGWQPFVHAVSPGSVFGTGSSTTATYGAITIDLFGIVGCESGSTFVYVPYVDGAYNVVLNALLATRNTSSKYVITATPGPNPGDACRLVSIQFIQ